MPMNDKRYEEAKTKLNISENERMELKHALRHVDERLHDLHDVVDSMHYHIRDMESQLMQIRREVECALDGALADLRDDENVREVKEYVREVTEDEETKDA